MNAGKLTRFQSAFIVVHRRLIAGFCIAALVTAAAMAVEPLAPDSLIRALLEEISAANALKETAAIASRTRYPNSQGFFDAADYVAAQARAYGLENVRIERFPQRAPLWDAEEAELSIVSPVSRQISTLAENPELLAQNSSDGDLTAPLVDVGNGLTPSSHEGKDLSGKVALADAEPEGVWPAMGDRGAAALICATQGDYFGIRTPPDAVVWGRSPAGKLTMMVSPNQGKDLREMLRRGPVTVRMRARARRASPGAIGMVISEIPGSATGRDVVLAAHLDHQKPGANDNASGSGTLLEAARTLQSLIATRKISKPRRAIRFWWTTEIVSEQAYFRRYPEDAKNISLAIVLDQAGGERDAENNFVVIFNPEWLPSYADDLIYNLAEDLKERYAPAEHAPDALAVAPGGGRQSMRNVFWEYQPITDEVAFEALNIGIPGIALAVPSLRLIHSNLDTVDRLDPTWMKRSALMALLPALYIANAGPTEAKAILDYTFRRAASRIATSQDPARQLALERKRLDSVRALDPTLDISQYQNRLTAVATALK